MYPESDPSTIVKSLDELDNILLKGRVEELQAALLEAIKYVEELIPSPSHPGSCHPDAGCDGACMDRANMSSMISGWYKVLGRL